MPPGAHPKRTLQILIFCLAQTRAPVMIFDINRYNRQIFRQSLRVPPPRGLPQGGPPIIKFLHDQTYDVLISVDISDANILQSLGVPIPPPRGPHKRAP